MLKSAACFFLVLLLHYTQGVHRSPLYSSSRLSSSPRSDRGRGYGSFVHEGVSEIGAILVAEESQRPATAPSNTVVASRASQRTPNLSDHSKLPWQIRLASIFFRKSPTPASSETATGEVNADGTTGATQSLNSRMRLYQSLNPFMRNICGRIGKGWSAVTRWFDQHKRSSTLAAKVVIYSGLAFFVMKRISNWYVGMAEYELLLDDKDFSYQTKGTHIYGIGATLIASLDPDIVRSLQYDGLYHQIISSLDLPCFPRNFNGYALQMGRDTAEFLSTINLRIRQYNSKTRKLQSEKKQLKRSLDHAKAEAARGNEVEERNLLISSLQDQIQSIDSMLRLSLDEVQIITTLQRSISVLQARQADAYLRLARFRVLNAVNDCEELLAYWQKRATRSTHTQRLPLLRAFMHQFSGLSTGVRTQSIQSLRSVLTSINAHRRSATNVTQTRHEGNTDLIGIGYHTSAATGRNSSESAAQFVTPRGGAASRNGLSQAQVEMMSVERFDSLLRDLNAREKEVILEMMRKTFYTLAGTIQRHLEHLTDIGENLADAVHSPIGLTHHSDTDEVLEKVDHEHAYVQCTSSAWSALEEWIDMASALCTEANAVMVVRSYASQPLSAAFTSSVSATKATVKQGGTTSVQRSNHTARMMNLHRLTDNDRGTSHLQDSNANTNAFNPMPIEDGSVVSTEDHSFDRTLSSDDFDENGATSDNDLSPGTTHLDINATVSNSDHELRSIGGTSEGALKIEEVVVSKRVEQSSVANDDKYEGASSRNTSAVGSVAATTTSMTERNVSLTENSASQGTSMAESNVSRTETVASEADESVDIRSGEGCTSHIMLKLDAATTPQPKLASDTKVTTTDDISDEFVKDDMNASQHMQVVVHPSEAFAIATPYIERAQTTAMPSIAMNEVAFILPPQHRLDVLAPLAAESMEVLENSSHATVMEKALLLSETVFDESIDTVLDSCVLNYRQGIIRALQQSSMSSCPFEVFSWIKWQNIQNIDYILQQSVVEQQIAEYLQRRIPSFHPNTIMNVNRVWYSEVTFSKSVPALFTASTNALYKIHQILNLNNCKSHASGSDRAAEVQTGRGSAVFEDLRPSVTGFELQRSVYDLVASTAPVPLKSVVLHCAFEPLRNSWKNPLRNFKFLSKLIGRNDEPSVESMYKLIFIFSAATASPSSSGVRGTRLQIYMMPPKRRSWIDFWSHDKTVMDLQHLASGWNEEAKRTIATAAGRTAKGFSSHDSAPMQLSNPANMERLMKLQVHGYNVDELIHRYFDSFDSREASHRNKATNRLKFKPMNDGAVRNEDALEACKSEEESSGKEYHRGSDDQSSCVKVGGATVVPLSAPSPSPVVAPAESFLEFNSSDSNEDELYEATLLDLQHEAWSRLMHRNFNQQKTYWRNSGLILKEIKKAPIVFREHLNAAGLQKRHRLGVLGLIRFRLLLRIGFWMGAFAGGLELKKKRAQLSWQMGVIVQHLNGFIERRITKPAISILNDVVLNKRTSITDAKALADSQRSLKTMIFDFLTQKYPRMSDAERRRLADSMDMQPISQEYEKELKRPIPNIVSGKLARLILIQLQFVKKELLVAMQAIDELFNANQVNLQLLSVTPAVIVMLSLQILSRTLMAVIRATARGRVVESASAVFRELRNNMRRIEQLLCLSDGFNHQDAVMSVQELGELMSVLHRVQNLLVLNSAQFDHNLLKQLQEDLRDLVLPHLTTKQRLSIVERINRAYPFMQPARRLFGSGLLQ